MIKKFSQAVFLIEKLTKNKPTIPSTLEEELKNNIPMAELNYIENSGHFVMLEEAKLFYNKVLNWL